MSWPVFWLPAWFYPPICWHVFRCTVESGHGSSLSCCLPLSSLPPILVVLSSRTGWLGAIVGVGLMIPYLRRFAAKAPYRMWLLMIVLGLSVSWSLSSSTGWSPKEERVSLESARSIHIPQAFNMFLKQPLAGYGYGTFETSFITQTAQWHQADPEQHYGLAALDHPHNELLYWGIRRRDHSAHCSATSSGSRPCQNKESQGRYSTGTGWPVFSDNITYPTRIPPSIIHWRTG